MGEARACTEYLVPPCPHTHIKSDTHTQGQWLSWKVSLRRGSGWALYSLQLPLLTSGCNLKCESTAARGWPLTGGLWCLYTYVKESNHSVRTEELSIPLLGDQIFVIFWEAETEKTGWGDDVHQSVRAESELSEATLTALSNPWTCHHFSFNACIGFRPNSVVATASVNAGELVITEKEVGITFNPSSLPSVVICASFFIRHNGAPQGSILNTDIEFNMKCRLW